MKCLAVLWEFQEVLPTPSPALSAPGEMLTVVLVSGGTFEYVCLTLPTWWKLLEDCPLPAEGGLSMLPSEDQPLTPSTSQRMSCFVCLHDVPEIRHFMC